MKQLPKTTKEVKTIQVPFCIEKGKLTEDDQYFHFQGMASTFGNIDRDGDIIEKGAFKESIKEIMARKDQLPILWQHNQDMPLGIYIDFKENSEGLFVEGRMPKSDTFVNGRVMPQMKVGSVSKLSIGFFILDHEFKTIDKKSVRVIKKVELLEVSLVTIPANNEANITDMKSATPYGNLPLAPRDKEWSKSDALGRVRKLTGSTEEPSAKYKKAFFWYDSENEDKFGSYKLPFADVVDGTLKAVPRAIFAVAAALRGARGGVNISQADKDKIISNVNKYYDKMAREFDDDTIVSPFKEDTKSLINNCKKLSDIEELLKKHLFSNKESEMVISKISEIKKLGDPVDNDKGLEPLSQEIANTFLDLKNLINN